MVRGTVALPSGTGKDVRVAVFAQGDAAAAAREAGADIVGADDLVAQVEGGMLDFDVAIATPGPHAPGRQARSGARPPRPDAEPEDRHRHHRRRQGRHRLQGRQGRVPHRPPRQRARPDRQGQLRRRRPCSPTSAPCSRSSSGPSRPSAKGRYFKRVAVSSTMGPGVKIDPPACSSSTRPRRLIPSPWRSRRRAATLEGSRPAPAGHPQPKIRSPQTSGAPRGVTGPRPTRRAHTAHLTRRTSAPRGVRTCSGGRPVVVPGRSGR